MLARAICVFATLHAAAAVAGAKVPDRRARALSIFVTFVANLTPFVAPVRASGTVDVFRASLQAAIGQRVASEAGLAIAGTDAGDAAVAGWLAARHAVRRAVGVHRALNTLALRAVRAGQAFSERTTAAQASAAASSIAGCAAALSGRAARPCNAGDAAAHRAAARRATEVVAAEVGRATAAGSAGLDVELEAPIAGCAPRPQSQDQRGARPAPAAQRGERLHGSAESFFASPTAKPWG